MDTTSELRRATLLFADIHASTELIQDLDPEEVENLLAPPVRMMTECVERYDGMVSPRGDGIMAVFGATIQAEDHTVRACFAALETLERIASAGNRVQVRIGIHVGEVVVRGEDNGRPGGRDVFGSAIHVAARLEQTAEPGMACISRAGYDFARGFVHATVLPPIMVRGISAPVERVLLRGIDHSANRWRVRAARGLTPFVDRETELSTLTASLRDLGRGEIRVLQIVGEAGVGKSRLLREFLNSDAARACCLVPLTGNKLHSHIPYETISRWLRDSLGIHVDPSAPGLRPDLDWVLRGLGAFSSDDVEALKRVLGLSARRDRDPSTLGAGQSLPIAEPVSRIIRRVAGDRDIILVCEDLDLFDKVTRDLIPDLARALREATVLLLTTSRRRIRLRLATERSPATLHIGPLATEDAARMLRCLDQRIGQDADRVTEVLLKAAGNPLFIEEVSALVQRDGSADGDGEDAGLAAPVESRSAIPDKVEALIVDRLARLPREARQILRMAAAIGYDVPVALLARLADMPPEATYRHLLRLQSEGLLYETRQYRGRQFSFKHALTREVAYNTMLRSQRRGLHVRIVQILEDPGAVEHEQRLEALCYHTARGQMWERAIEYLRDAARVAEERWVIPQAEQYLARALDITGNLTDGAARARSGIDILLDLESLARMQLRYNEAERMIERAEKLAAELGDPVMVLRVSVRRLRLLNVAGRLHDAIKLGERFAERAEELGNMTLRINIAHSLGQAYFDVGAFDRAERIFSDVIDLKPNDATELPMGAGSMPVLIGGTRGAGRAFLGHFAAAREDVERASRHASGVNRSYDILYTMFIDGLLRLQQRQITDAILVFRDALEQATIKHLHTLIPSLQTGLGHALLLRAATDPPTIREAIELLSAARTTATERQREIIRVWATLALGMAHFCNGQDGLAEKLSAEAVELATRFDMRGFLVFALRARGTILAADQATAVDGLRCLARGLRLARRLGMVVEVAHTLIAIDLVQPAPRRRRRDIAARILDKVGMHEWRTHLLGHPDRAAFRRAF